MKIFKLAVYVSLFIIIGSELTLNAQDFKNTKVISDYIKLSKIVKKTGWELPKKNELKISSKEDIDFEGFSISVTNLKPKKDIDAEYQEYFLKNDNSLSIKNINTRLIGINSYEIKGKIFAYKVFYAFLLIGSDGSRGLAGAVFSVYHYDEDGDGVFETLYTNKQSTDYLPEWIRKQ
jgi:hypothetical protein